jgi:alpha-galactosidase
LENAAAAGAIAAMPGTQLGHSQPPVSASHAQSASIVDVLRMPDSVAAFSGLDHRVALKPASGNFKGNDISVSFDRVASELRVRITAPATALTHVHMRWLQPTPATMLCLGDHWERSYGDLAWRCETPERVMPWYFATSIGTRTNAYGVKTGAAAMCFWQLDPQGVSLWLDVSNGGSGVLLGDRELPAATLVSREGHDGETPMAALRAFCRQMCPTPRLPHGAVFGVNDWYCAYGNNNEQMLLGMADLVAELAPAHPVQPYAVVDMGWKDGSSTFPSMAAFAERVKKKGVRPGIWIRPFEASPDTRPSLLLPEKRFGARQERFKELAFDPTVPDAMEQVRQKFRQLSDWGFALVKHDFSTYDFLGQWGFEMGALPALSGWHPYDRSRTNAEILLDFYKDLRTTLGETITILGCNTVGHLGAGLFELQRTGDDTSGRIWERTRRMGVNTLAYRLPQHNTFFHIDADCVGITKDIPWELNRQWLDLVARSRTALFISPEAGQVGREQREALREAFELVTSTSNGAEPVDLLHETTPEHWTDGVEQRQYRWYADEGAYPFVV